MADTPPPPLPLHKKRGSFSKISQKTLEERLDFSNKPVSSFHEALTRLLPPPARSKATPRRLTKSAPSSDMQAPGHRDCNCEQQKNKRKVVDLTIGRCLCFDASPEEQLSEGGSPPVHFERSSSSVVEKQFDPGHFRSSAVYCEVKLAELLNERDSRGDCLANSNVPDVYRTAACWQIFNEICKLSMPFARVLVRIRDELEHAIYSTYVAPPGLSPTFERLPYFEIVQRLEGKSRELDEKQRRWREELCARETDISRIEDHMQELRDQVKAANSVSSDLKSKLNFTVGALEAAKEQVKSLQQKSKQLKKDLKKASGMVLKSREIEYEKEMEKKKHHKMQTQYSQLVHELQHTQSFLDAARSEAADSVPKPVFFKAKEDLQDLEERLTLTEAEIEDISHKVNQMTPRPNWEKASSKSTNWRATTSEQVSAICRENNLLSEQLSCLELEWTAAQVALSELMLKLPPAEEDSKKGKDKDKKKKDKKKKK